MSTRRGWAEILDLASAVMDPHGLCADRAEHRAHLFDSETLGRFWCTADQSAREPWRSERRRTAREELARMRERAPYVVGPPFRHVGSVFPEDPKCIGPYSA